MRGHVVVPARPRLICPAPTRIQATSLANRTRGHIQTNAGPGARVHVTVDGLYVLISEDSCSLSRGPRNVITLPRAMAHMSKADANTTLRTGTILCRAKNVDSALWVARLASDAARPFGNRDRAGMATPTRRVTYGLQAQSAIGTAGKGRVGPARPVRCLSVARNSNLQPYKDTKNRCTAAPRRVRQALTAWQYVGGGGTVCPGWYCGAVATCEPGCMTTGWRVGCWAV